MDGFFVAKLKKFSNVVPKPKDEDEDLNGDQMNGEPKGEIPVEESNGLAVENIAEKERKGESTQMETSPDQSVTQGVTGSAKKRRKKKRKSKSSQAETSPEKSLTEDVKSPVKKRKMENHESESSQVEMSPEKSVTEDVKSPKKRRKRHKKKKAIVTENSETSEVLTSPNSVSTSDKSLVQEKDKAKKRKLEQAHTDDRASPPKEKRLSPAQNGLRSGLTKAHKWRLKKKLKKLKLAEGGQGVTTADGKVPSGAQEKAKENESLPTLSDTQVSKKAKRHRKKKKVRMVSEKPNGDASAQLLDTSVEPAVVPGEKKKKKKKKRKKKLPNDNVAESRGDSVPQRVWESGDVGQSVTSEESRVSKENKPQLKAAKLKGKLASKRVAFKASVANKRLKKQRKKAKASAGL